MLRKHSHEADFQPPIVEDDDVLAVVADQPGPLQDARGDRHAGAAHPEHVREHLVRQRQHVGAGALAAEQQPARESLLNRVERVAGRGLRRHREQRARVAQEAALELLVAAEGVARVLGLHPQRAPVHLHQRLVRGGVRAEQHRDAAHALAPGQPDLDGRAVFEHGDERDEAALDEVDVVNLFLGVVQVGARLSANG